MLLLSCFFINDSYEAANNKLLVGWQEGHPHCKKTERWDAGVVICPGEVQICTGPADATATHYLLFQ